MKKRLDRIGKGTADCDGYTSNTEEATFIVILFIYDIMIMIGNIEERVA